MKSPRRTVGGFTLIEIMVALTIFALMSGVAYRGLDAVLQAHARVAQEAGKWRDLALVFASIQRSLAAVAERPVRDASGSVAPSFAGASATRSEDEVPLVFTRMGFSDRGGALADLQRTGYRVRAGNLEMLMWPVLDQAPATRPEGVVLVAGVTEMSLRFLAKDGGWRSAWPMPGDETPTPVAVEMSLRLTSGEKITRLFGLR